MTQAQQLIALKEKVMARIASMDSIAEVKNVAKAAGLGDISGSAYSLSKEEMAAVKEGLADVAAGRVFSLQETLSHLDEGIKEGLENRKKWGSYF